MGWSPWQTRRKLLNNAGDLKWDWLVCWSCYMQSSYIFLCLQLFLEDCFTAFHELSTTLSLSSFSLDDFASISLRKSKVIGSKLSQNFHIYSLTWICILFFVFPLVTVMICQCFENQFHHFASRSQPILFHLFRNIASAIFTVQKNVSLLLDLIVSI